MSRKHNCKHPDRSLSNYSQRLVRRGFHKAPALQSLEDLRRRQKDKDPAKELLKEIYEASKKDEVDFETD